MRLTTNFLCLRYWNWQSSQQGGPECFLADTSSHFCSKGTVANDHLWVLEDYSLKGTVSRDFCFITLSWIIFLQASDSSMLICAYWKIMYLKGQWHEIFCFIVLSWIIFHQDPESSKYSSLRTGKLCLKKTVHRNVMLQKLFYESYSKPLIESFQFFHKFAEVFIKCSSFMIFTSTVSLTLVIKIMTILSACFQLKLKMKKINDRYLVESTTQ
jgi:hypothetical protein